MDELEGQAPDWRERVSLVVAAFPDPGCPVEAGPTCSCWECADIKEFLRAHPFWRDWTPSDCFKMNTTSLMGDAFGYFLPAYICATYMDPVAADVAVDFSAWHILWHDERTLFRRLTELQRDRVIDWLHYYADRWSSGDERAGYMLRIEELQALSATLETSDN